ncbi:MAG: LPS assembly lipoprotein LptE [Pedobacter sp.]
MRFLSVAVILILLCGCGYHLTGSAENRLASGQSLWVAFIVNETISPSAQTVIRRALLEEGHAMRGLAPAGNEAEGDLQVKGILRSYSIRSLSYTALDRVKEYRLTIDVELELYRKGGGAPIWKGMLQSSQDYPAATDLARQRDAEEAALAAASRILAQKFLTAIEQSY